MVAIRGFKEDCVVFKSRAFCFRINEAVLVVRFREPCIADVAFFVIDKSGYQRKAGQSVNSISYQLFNFA